MLCSDPIRVIRMKHRPLKSLSSGMYLWEMNGAKALVNIRGCGRRFVRSLGFAEDVLFSHLVFRFFSVFPFFTFFGHSVARSRNLPVKQWLVLSSTHVNVEIEGDHRARVTRCQRTDADRHKCI